MGNLKKIPKYEVKRIASEYKIAESIIHEVYYEIETYANHMHDSFENFKKLPYPKYDELPWSKDPLEWAKLSLFYYSKQNEIGLPEPKIFKEVVFKPSKGFGEQLRLSEFVTNHIIKTYLEKMINEGLLLEQQKAKELIDYANRYGKRKIDYYAK